MTKLGEAYIPLRLTLDKLDKDLSDARGKIEGSLGGMKGIGQKFGNALATGAKAGVAGMGLALAGGVVAVGKFAADSIAAFIPFEKQMNEVFTLLPGISDGAMNDMTDDVLKFAAKFGTLPEEVVPALYEAISAGVPPENVFSFLETSQKAAVGGVTDLTIALDGITSTVNAYGEDVISATEASDLMFTAVKLGKTNFEELSNSLFQVNPTAAALGVSFGDVAAGMASITAQGVPTSVAATQLRQLLVELSKDGSKASDAFKEVAGVGFAEFIAQGHNLEDALAILTEASAGSGVALQDMFGSVEAGNAALALTGAGADRFSANLAEMANSTGATDTAFATMDEGIGRSLEKLQAFGQVVKLQTGQALSPLLVKLTELAEKAMPWVKDVIERAIPVIEKFTKELSGKLGPAIAIIVDALSRIAIALGLASEESSGADMVIALLTKSLDLIVTAVEATAVAFHILANVLEVLALALPPWLFVKSPTPLELGIKGLLAPLQSLIDLFRRLSGVVSSLRLPAWLTPGSPTPLELGIKGLSRAIEQMPDLGAKFAAGEMLMQQAGALAGGDGGGSQVNKSWNLTINSPLPPNVNQNFDMLQAMEGA